MYTCVLLCVCVCVCVLCVCVWACVCVCLSVFVCGRVLCLKRESQREKEEIKKRFGKPHVRHAQGSNLA